MEETLVSVCMPYWNRAHALECGLRNLCSWYGARYGQKLEVSICDDGSGREPLRSLPIEAWTDSRFRYVTTVRPMHEQPGNSAEALAQCVRQSSGQVVVVQNPETTHTKNVLDEMINAVMAGISESRLFYVICACHDDCAGMWYEHTRHRKLGFHWCVAAHRKLWDRVLESFPPAWLFDGLAYEDNVLRNTVLELGAEFIWRDDLVVHHHKEWQEKYKGASGARDYFDQKLVRVNQNKYNELYSEEWRAKYLRPLGIGGE